MLRQSQLNTIRRYHQYGEDFWNEFDKKCPSEFWSGYHDPRDGDYIRPYVCSPLLTIDELRYYSNLMTAVDPQYRAAFTSTTSRERFNFPGKYRILIDLNWYNENLTKKKIEPKQLLIINYLNEVALPLTDLKWKIENDQIVYHVPLNQTSNLNSSRHFLTEKMSALFQNTSELQEIKIENGTNFTLRNNIFLYTQIWPEAETKYKNKLLNHAFSLGENTKKLPQELVGKISFFLSLRDANRFARVSKETAEATPLQVSFKMK